jgi:predicted protein tyrosine phosphatase
VRVLFVCTANISRSPTAEAVFRELTRADPAGHEARSAGISAERGSGRQVTEADLEWADVVCVMEAAHYAYLLRRWSLPAGKVRVLGIPDMYSPGDPVLEELLRTQILLLLAEGGAWGSAPQK